MPSSSLDLKQVDNSERFSNCCSDKKEWQTPKLTEMDYNQTYNGSDWVVDAGGFS